MPLTTILTLATLLHPVAQPDAAELRAEIEGLLETGRVLYIAAHPDDENTQFLAWAVGERGYRAAYLSLTRGDGGQNLIGDEQSPLLGVIRTWELLAARGIDHAEQLMGNVRDFGYSKSAEETLAVWGEEATLADVVWVIRTFRPHVVVTRFPEEGTTHGHHLASARLAGAAFEAAGDPERFPEQLGEHGDGAGRFVVEPWTPVRLAYNLPHWRMDDDTDTSGYLAVDVGGYSPLLGSSWGEVSARSRSQHRSQGFGRAGTRGSQPEYFDVLAGEPADGDLFEGIDASWAALEGGPAVERHLRQALDVFDETNPAGSATHLISAWQALAAAPEAPITQAEVAEVIAACLGLALDARVADPMAVRGETIEVTASALLRSGGDVSLEAITVGDLAIDTGWSNAMPLNETIERTLTVEVPDHTALSAPYWLTRPPTGGRYTEAPPHLRGQPVSPPPLMADFRLRVGGQLMHLRRPVRYVWGDPVLGERARPLTVMPPLTTTPVDDVAMAVGGSATVRIDVQAFTEVRDGRVTLEVPADWELEPTFHPLSLDRLERTRLEFLVSPPDGATRTELRPLARHEGPGYSWRLDVIDYPHIPTQAVLRPAVATVQPIELTPLDGVVGYVMGPGDRVASSLQSVGVDVRLLEPGDLEEAALNDLDALLIGIRAFNVHPELHDRLDSLLEWVATGHTLVVQYQTNNRFNPLDRPIGPAALTIGRGRVTDELAAVTRLDEAHPVWSQPHAITDDDFAGWVQERGLYFGETWDEAWTPLLEMNDEGEDPLRGSLLVARHGDGVVVYTGLSFFRQLPAGVPGAYRLLINLLSLGTE